MCETHRHSGATEVMELPREVGRDSAALSGASMPRMSPSERAAARLESQPAAERLVFEPLAGTDPVTVDPRSSRRAGQTDAPANSNPQRGQNPVRPVEAREVRQPVEPVKPEAETPPVVPERAPVASKPPVVQDKNSRQQPPTIPPVASKTVIPASQPVGPAVPPQTPSAKSPAPVPAARKDAPRQDRSTAASTQSPNRVEWMRDILATALKEQGNHSGTQKSQQPRILAWQNEVLNALHQAIDGNRFQARELREGPARTAALVFIRDAARKALGADVALPKFLTK